MEGIIGRFWEFGHDLDDYRDAVIDKETGYTNCRGMLMAGIEFMDNYLKKGEDFTAVYFYVPALESAARSYGEAFRRELLRRLAEEVHQAIVPGSVLAHIGSGRFLCFHKLIHEQRLRDRLLRLANAIHNIHSVRGCPCTLYLQYAVGYGSETKSIEGLLQLLVERGEAARKDHLGESIYIGDRIAFDREKFDHMNERVYMCDPETYDLVYINQAIYFMDLPKGISCAFFFGDVNGLKRMNDEHGHEAGDALIKTVADIMLQAQRWAGKGHVFRMGGDEFLMIVEQLDETHVEEVQQSLREAFRTHHVSVALGALVSMTPIPDMDAIITKVDREMYKDKGKKKR